ncbi:hypothetical protein GTW40_00965 [Streptomyces sp. SID4985]|uniref:hypothetical protein n=1 Tax=Streptomyces sp. SID4985 TaxID=2690292 RepID=UPI00136A98B4|nr:hypothetical protein [Streptomyces sp. SID4985]MYQ43650.1 hypothetical protein [Streptomyces sp. SID4985]
MRNPRPLFRTGLSLAGAAALPVLFAGPSAAVSGISVSANGSIVSVSTSACATQTKGSWGNASLLFGGQSSFEQGVRSALSGTAGSQSAAWSGVGPGTYTVMVICANGISAGTRTITVGAASAPTISATSRPPATPSRSAAAPSRSTATPSRGAVAPSRTTATPSRGTATASRAAVLPSRGVAGGLGGAVSDYGPVTLGIGAGLAGSGIIAAAWFLRRPKPRRRYY